MRKLPPEMVSEADRLNVPAVHGGPGRPDGRPDGAAPRADHQRRALAPQALDRHPPPLHRAGPGRQGRQGDLRHPGRAARERGHDRGRQLPPARPRRRRRRPAPQGDDPAPGHPPASPVRPPDPAHAARGRGQARAGEGARLPARRDVARAADRPDPGRQPGARLHLGPRPPAPQRGARLHGHRAGRPGAGAGGRQGAGAVRGRRAACAGSSSKTCCTAPTARRRRPSAARGTSAIRCTAATS